MREGGIAMPTVADLNALGIDHFPDHLGIVFTRASPEEIRSELTIRKALMERLPARRQRGDAGGYVVGLRLPPASAAGRNRLHDHRIEIQSLEHGTRRYRRM